MHTHNGSNRFESSRERVIERERANKKCETTLHGRKSNAMHSIPTDCICVCMCVCLSKNKIVKLTTNYDREKMANAIRYIILRLFGLTDRCACRVCTHNQRRMASIEPTDAVISIIIDGDFYQCCWCCC